MSTVCVDLLRIVEVVNDFLYFLGPELKAVTGDTVGIDAVIHVSGFSPMQFRCWIVLKCSQNLDQLNINAVKVSGSRKAISSLGSLYSYFESYWENAMNAFKD